MNFMGPGGIPTDGERGKEGALLVVKKEVGIGYRI